MASKITQKISYKRKSMKTCRFFDYISIIIFSKQNSKRDFYIFLWNWLWFLFVKNLLRGVALNGSGKLIQITVVKECVIMKIRWNKIKEITEKWSNIKNIFND